MKSDKKLDLLLKQALSPEEEPNDWLNQRILRRAKETENMKKTYKKRIPAAAMVTVLTLCVGSATAFAAWKYMSPDKVAEVTEDKGLAAAFQGKDAITINETQEYGKYKITLLGVVSGKNLSQYMTADDAGKIKEDRTYVVTAIENADGTPRPATNDDAYGEEPFFVSPLIKGYNPEEYNIVTMNGGYTEIVEEGIQYRISECDNVEIFADQGLYLCVSDSSFYKQDAYKYDETTGEITRNENYDGVNALFDLPMDKSKADKAAAEEYIKELEEQKNNSETDVDAGLAEKVSEWSEEELKEKATLLEELTQVLTPDEDGYISYHYQVGENDTESDATINVAEVLGEEETGMCGFNSEKTANGETVYIETFTRNEDGTITLEVYQYSE